MTWQDVNLPYYNSYFTIVNSKYRVVCRKYTKEWSQIHDWNFPLRKQKKKSKLNGSNEKEWRKNILKHLQINFKKYWVKKSI